MKSERIKNTIEEKLKTFSREFHSSIAAFKMFAEGDPKSEIACSEHIKLAAATLSECGDITWQAFCVLNSEELFPVKVPKKFYFPRQTTEEEFMKLPGVCNLTPKFPDVLEALRTLQFFVTPEPRRCHEYNNTGKHTQLEEVAIAEPITTRLSNSAIHLDLGGGCSAIGTIEPAPPEPEGSDYASSPIVSWKITAADKAIKTNVDTPFPGVFVISLGEDDNLPFNRHICYSFRLNPELSEIIDLRHFPQRSGLLYVRNAFGFLTEENKLLTPSMTVLDSLGHPFRDLAAAFTLYENAISVLLSKID